MERITITLDAEIASALREEAERDGKRGVASVVRAALIKRYPFATCTKPPKKGGRK